MNTKVILTIITILSLLLVACQPAEQQATEDSLPSNEELAPEDEPTETTPPSWLDTELKDVLTQETYTLSQFDKPILLESFAVWCPLCTKQQKNVKALHEELGDSFISVALNTDPNEDETQVIEHAESNGFDWKFTVSPKEFTQALVNDFGVGVVNAPSVPMILVCENSAKLLSKGVKSVEELKQALQQC